MNIGDGIDRAICAVPAGEAGEDTIGAAGGGGQANRRWSSNLADIPHRVSLSFVGPEVKQLIQ